MSSNAAYSILIENPVMSLKYGFPRRHRIDRNLTNAESSDLKWSVVRSDVDVSSISLVVRAILNLSPKIVIAGGAALAAYNEGTLANVRDIDLYVPDEFKDAVNLVCRNFDVLQVADSCIQNVDRGGNGLSKHQYGMNVSMYAPRSSVPEQFHNACPLTWQEWRSRRIDRSVKRLKKELTEKQAVLTEHPVVETEIVNSGVPGWKSIPIPPKLLRSAIDSRRPVQLIDKARLYKSVVVDIDQWSSDSTMGTRKVLLDSLDGAFDVIYTSCDPIDYVRNEFDISVAKTCLIDIDISTMLGNVVSLYPDDLENRSARYAFNAKMTANWNKLQSMLTRRVKYEQEKGYTFVPGSSLSKMSRILKYDHRLDYTVFDDLTERELPLYRRIAEQFVRQMTEAKQVWSISIDQKRMKKFAELLSNPKPFDLPFRWSAYHKMFTIVPTNPNYIREPRVDFLWYERSIYRAICMLAVDDLPVPAAFADIKGFKEAMAVRRQFPSFRLLYCREPIDAADSQHVRKVLIGIEEMMIANPDLRIPQPSGVTRKSRQLGNNE